MGQNIASQSSDFLQSSTNSESDFKTSEEAVKFVFNALLRDSDVRELAEAVTLIMYKFIIGITVGWYEDDYTENNLSNLTKQIISILKEVCPPVYYMISDLDVPPELFACRLVRTLFSRELPISQLKQLWDFIFLDGFIHRKQLRVVPELTAVVLYNILFDLIAQYPNCNKLQVQQMLFEYSRASRIYKEDCWRVYISQV